ncbi:MAG: beta strand repeat-containing protein [Isosphaerales bacterium]
MRRKIRRSLRTSSPVLRRAFRPVLSRLEDRTLLATATWTGAGGNSNWADFENWSTNEVPGATDDVVIYTGPGVVVQTSGSVTVNNLALSSASLDVGGTLAVNGLLTLSPGDANTTALAGSGTVDAYGGMSISGNLQLTGVTLNNYAAAAWDFSDVVNTTNMTLSSGASIDNMNGASFTAEGTTGASAVVAIGNSSQTAFNNAGNFFSSTSTYSSITVDVPFTNSDSVDVMAGTLNLGLSSAPQTGSFLDGSQTTLSLDGGSLGSPSRVISSGTIELIGCSDAGTFSSTASTLVANVAFTGTVENLGYLEVLGDGTVSFEQPQSSVEPAGGIPTAAAGSLTLDLLTLDPGATLISTMTATSVGYNFVVNGYLWMQYRSELDTSGVVQANDGLEFEGENAVECPSLEIAGGGGYAEGATIYLSSGTVVVNESNQDFNAFGDITLTGGQFWNLGTMYLNGTRDFIDGTEFFNEDAVTMAPAAVADVELDSRGFIVNDSGATFTFAGDGVVGSGDGTGSFVNSGTVTLGTSANVGTLYVDSATLQGSGEIVGNVYNEGQILTVYLGAPTITGDYTQHYDGTLNVQLQGPPSDYEPLSVSGTASLGGSLQVTDIGSYTPNVGSAYQVLTAGATSGNFTSLSGLAVQSVLLSPTVSATSVVLTAEDATDEPAVQSVIQSLVDTAPRSGASIELQTTSTASLDAAATAVGAVTQNSQNPAPLSVTLDLSNASYHNSIFGGTIPIEVTAPPGVAVTLNGPASGRATLYDLHTSGAVSLHGNVGGPIFLWGLSPALVVDSGMAQLENVTATTSTDAPTIVVNGGSLNVRDSTIDQSSSYDQPAIQINGGSVDLGTPTDLGGNTIDADGTSDPIQNNTGNPVSIAGDYFTSSGVSVPVNLTVVNTAGSGLGSLPYAILEANSNPGSAGSIIQFNIPTTDPGYDSFRNAWEITVSSTLVLAESDGPEVIQGPGANKVVILGNGTGTGFTVGSSVAGVTISDLTIASFTTGIVVDPSGSATISGNRFGGYTTFAYRTSNEVYVNVYGITDGIEVDSSGSATITGNQIEPNSGGRGIVVDLSGSATITGNTISTEPFTSSFGDGIVVSGDATIGGTSAGARNGIDDYSGYGVLVESSGTATITDNGIYSGGGTGVEVAGLATIGGTCAAAGNDISAGNIGCEFANGGSGSLDGNSLRGGTDDLYIASGAGTVSLGAAAPNEFGGTNGAYIDNASPQTIDATDSTYWGSSPNRVGRKSRLSASNPLDC